MFQIMMNGRHIFMGYLNKPDKTAETIDGESGWMRTGDIGRLDKEGHLYITGRIKGTIFFENMFGGQFPLMGPLIPLFWTPLSFKAKVGSFIHT